MPVVLGALGILGVSMGLRVLGSQECWVPLGAGDVQGPGVLGSEGRAPGLACYQRCWEVPWVFCCPRSAGILI